MKKVKNSIPLIIALLLTVTLLAGCGSKHSYDSAAYSNRSNSGGAAINAASESMKADFGYDADDVAYAPKT